MGHQVVTVSVDIDFVDLLFNILKTSNELCSSRVPH